MKHYRNCIQESGIIAIDVANSRRKKKKSPS